MTLRTNPFTEEPFELVYEHASVSADTTLALWKASRRMRITKVRYVNDTGLAVDVTNFYSIKVLKDAVVVSTWSTETGQEGALVAATFVDPTLSAVAGALVVETNSVISLFLDESGAATLPIGRIQIEGRYI